MKKLALQCSVTLIGFLTAIFLFISVDRLRMNYNEQGVYFDEETATTYYSQALEVYCGITAVLLLLTILLLFWMRKLS